jgi:hypothetical protein
MANVSHPMTSYGAELRPLIAVLKSIEMIMTGARRLKFSLNSAAQQTTMLYVGDFTKRSITLLRRLRPWIPKLDRLVGERDAISEPFVSCGTHCVYQVLSELRRDSFETVFERYLRAGFDHMKVEKRGCASHGRTRRFERITGNSTCISAERAEAKGKKDESCILRTHR